ncbi:MAG: O-antigen ligase family protein [Candidatus Omnitrophica bacterium]|nr:O-antigen ligase family protein [Candidatus Omnitrophota bacterium]
MVIALLILIFVRPFIASLAFPQANAIYSFSLILFLAVWIILRGPKIKMARPLRYPLLLFIVAILVSGLPCQNKGLFIASLDKYITAILIFIIVSSLSKDDHRIISCLLFTAIIISCLAFYQYIFGFRHILAYVANHNISDPFIQDYLAQKRIFFPFVTPNTLAGYLSMILPLAFTQKSKGVFYLTPIIIALLLTRSLGGIFSAGIAIFIYLCLKKKINAKTGARLATLLMAIITFVLFIRSAATKPHFQPLFSAAMRFNYWTETLRIILNHPFLGIGLGNFNTAYSRFSHNSYLQFWAETGILGIVSLVWFIFSLWTNALKNIKKSPHSNTIACLIAAITAFCLHNLVDFSFFLPEISFLWWVICGLLLAQTTE